MARARDGERGPLWFVTSEQTAGRGRRNRAWIAPRGNLAASILEVMPVSPPAAATLGFAAGLALGAALDRVTLEQRMRAAGHGGPRFTLKWPNDVLADGRKLCGILMEAEGVANGDLAVVVGMGTNVVAAPEGTPFPATSLHALGAAVSAEDLFGALSESWTEYRGIWDLGQGFAEIRRRWLEQAHGLGGPVSVNTGSGQVDGVFETIDASGSLIVAASDGRKTAIAAGDVHFGAVASVGAA